MKYFTRFPDITYNYKSCKNILARGKVRDYLKNNVATYYEYIVKDGERPDIIAHKYYGSSNHTWLIFYINDIFDIQYDWVLDYPKFISYIENKYNSVAESQSTLHHYENGAGLVIDLETYTNIDDSEKKAVYCYDYEYTTNENKRNIKLLEDIYVTSVVEEFRQLFI